MKREVSPDAPAEQRLGLALLPGRHHEKHYRNTWVRADLGQDSQDVSGKKTKNQREGLGGHLQEKQKCAP